MTEILAAKEVGRRRPNRYPLLGGPPLSGRTKTEGNGMPIIEGFDRLAAVPEEQITDKISRRVMSGKQARWFIGE